MSDEFREDIKSIIRKHDPTADELRSLSDDLDTLAERYDEQDDVL